MEQIYGNWNTLVTNHGRKFESRQPAPILYFGHDVEAERLWNEKMKDGGECVMPQTDSEHCNWEKTGSVAHHKQWSIQKGSKIKCWDVENINPKSLTSIEDSSLVSHRKAQVKQNKQQKPLNYPHGWLRTTPIVTLKQCNRVPYPKLNRTSLIRRAKLDSQLAHQLHTEVENQVKQRLKHLDESFDAEMIKIRRRKFAKGQTYSMLSVGCQTVEVSGGYVQNAEDISLKYSSPDPVNPVHRDEHHKEIEEHLRHKNQQRHEAFFENYFKKNYGMIKNGKEKISELKKNLTFDIDVTEIDSCINNYSNENYEDFEMSTDSQSSSVSNTVEKQNILNKCASKTERSVDRQKTSSSLSVSVSLGESKLESKERKPANKIRDNKLKEFDSKSRMYISSESVVREPSQDTGLTYLIHEELPQQEKNVAEVTTVEIHQNITKNVQSSPQNISTSHIHTNNLKCDDDTQCSQVSEVSEALDHSAEVFQEELKGRHADFLMRNDSQINDSKKEQLVTEEIDVCDECVPECEENIGEFAENSISEGNLSCVADECVPDSEENIGESAEEKYVGSSRKCSMTNMINTNIYGNRINISCKGLGMVDNSSIKIKKSKEMLTKYKMNEDSIYHLKRAMSPDFLENLDKVVSIKKSLNCESYSESRGSSPRGLDDIDSSISNISARIAALLMPRRVSLARLNTDSVSSYVPSGVSDNLSSLSDMMGD